MKLVASSYSSAQNRDWMAYQGGEGIVTLERALQERARQLVREVRGMLSLSEPAPRFRRQVVGEAPLAVDLVLYQGDDFTLLLEVSTPEDEPADLTGASARSQIRVTPPAQEVSAEFSTSIEQNVIYLHLPNQEAAKLAGHFAWDCKVQYADGQITTLAAGNVTATANVTRP